MRSDGAGTSFRSAEFAGEVEVAVVDDLAVDIDDDQFARSDFDDGGDVLVDVFRSSRHCWAGFAIGAWM